MIKERLSLFFLAAILGMPSISQAGGLQSSIGRILEASKAQVNREMQAKEIVKRIDNIKTQRDILDHSAAASIDVAYQIREDQVGVRIVGESGIATDNDFPFVVGIALKHPLSKKVRIVCGASVIGDRTVLTAAHCNLAPPQYLYIYVGPVKLNLDDKYLIPVKRFIVHPDFAIIKDASGQEAGARNDIAVIETSKPLGRAKIALADDASSLVPNSDAIVLGWGVVNTVTNETSDLLLYGHVTIRPRDVCSNAYKEAFDDSQLCAGTGETDACWGDSGSSLVDATHKILLGVVSYGKGCGLEAFPGVYARIDSLKGFIIPLIASTESTQAFLAQR